MFLLTFDFNPLDLYYRGCKIVVVIIIINRAIISMSNFKYFLGTMPITHSHLDISIPSETLVLLKELLSLFINPFNASRSKLLLFEGFSAILV